VGPRVPYNELTVCWGWWQTSGGWFGSMGEGEGGEGLWGTAEPAQCTAIVVHPLAEQIQNNSNHSTSRGTSMAVDTNGYDSYWGESYGTRKGNHGFVGLSNQGATCYMNSLLQTLYMTPEFRSALYRWKYDGGDEEDCIPLQLQRLFGLLQLSSRGSVETTALTKSFGWTSSMGFEQHDVQELCRVLFDALERVMAGTPQATFVTDLYQGSMMDYVLCQECKTETHRQDTFLDLSLVLRPFGSKEVMHSVLDSLDFFLKPETLDGDNRYFCEKCQQKCDAVKGLKFTKLPYLLSLQLKRFDYDYQTFQRIKLNDEVRFPLILDMNPYMSQASGEGPNAPARSESGGVDVDIDAGAEAKVPDLVDGDGGKAPEQEKEETVEQMCEEERSFHIPADSDKLLHEQGPWVYELYSVLIHSGSALGGHYYAYIRSLTDGQWYNFNDSSVSRIDVDTVKRAWGGRWANSYAAAGAKKFYNSGSTYSGANAYMLMYRRVEPSRNAGFPEDSSVPDYLVQRVKEDEDRAAKEKEEQQARINSLTLKCVSSDHPDGETVMISRKDTLYMLREKIWRQLGYEGKIPLDCLRLREFEQISYQTVPKEEPLTDDQATLEKLKIFSHRRLYVETRTPGQDWSAIKPSDLQLLIRVYEGKEERLAPPKQIFIGERWFLCT
jgi:ubiquitin carboxyl-terminal hydrolase 47